MKYRKTPLFFNIFPVNISLFNGTKALIHGTYNIASTRVP
jgi:hypothetical protein